ncbi:O-antigen ligase [uncultured Chloroflexus sp.]|uniref:O-antigen ligase family protein n=1 Tax=uncultured Chloroflexus sp. TaxID=214040 RepID=UPI00260F580A|nr:O-antigen ligase family protein [uncultured Chloroflexus sp.]
MKIKLRWLEYIWHVVAFTLLSGAFVSLWRGERSSDPVQQAVLLFSFAGLVLLLAQPRSASAIALKGWLLWLIVGWAFTSLLWSQSPDLTFRRSVTLLLATCYGLLLAVRYPLTTVLYLLGSAMAIIVIASAISIGVGAEWSVMGYPHPGAWRGITLHKNHLGLTCVLALIVAGILTQVSAMPWRLFWVGIACGAVVLVIGSRSATAIAVTILTVTTWFVLKTAIYFSGWDRLRLSFLGASLILPGGSLLFLNLPELLSLLGRDVSLTGRLPLWSALWSIGWQRPLLGYGFGAFWLDTGQEMEVDIALMRLRFGWALQAHNGYLDIWLELGLVGLLLTLIVLLIVLWRSLKLIDTPGIPFGAWFIVLFIPYLLFINIAEARLLEPNLGKSILWIMLSCCYFWVMNRYVASR